MPRQNRTSVLLYSSCYTSNLSHYYVFSLTFLSYIYRIPRRIFDPNAIFEERCLLSQLQLIDFAKPHLHSYILLLLNCFVLCFKVLKCFRRSPSRYRHLDTTTSSVQEYRSRIPVLSLDFGSQIPSSSNHITLIPIQVFQVRSVRLEIDDSPSYQDHLNSLFLCLSEVSHTSTLISYLLTYYFEYLLLQEDSTTNTSYQL